MSLETQNHNLTAREVRADLGRHGWVLRCSPRFNRESGEYGAYYVYDPRWGRIVFGYPFGTSLDLIGTWLETLPPE